MRFKSADTLFLAAGKHSLEVRHSLHVSHLERARADRTKNENRSAHNLELLLHRVKLRVNSKKNSAPPS